MVTLIKISDNEKIFKATREKTSIAHKGTQIKFMYILSLSCTVSDEMSSGIHIQDKANKTTNI